MTGKGLYRGESSSETTGIAQGKVMRYFLHVHAPDFTVERLEASLHPMSHTPCSA